MNTIISQALATGLPVISTRHSGIPDQVIEGKCGFLVEEGDFEALADKIIYLMDHPELWPGMGRFGREHILKKYNQKDLIDKQISLYERVLNA
ncbi:MAG: glycosyltransferase [Candidatus Portnoybacteria bacterium]|nr:glycosyltransferase [Candidatus Portnoybacteria bacterium]